MYRISDAFRAALLQQSRKYRWSGTIRCTDGTQYAFGPDNISSRSHGVITRRVSDGTGIELGSTCAAELDISLFLGNVNRYQLYDADIELTYTQQIGEVRTWGEAEAYSWDDLSSTTWGASPKVITGTIPMGVFTISEINRTAKELQIKAYDYMLKFDKSFRPDDTGRPAYDWLLLICKACGVALGMTRNEVRGLTNGTRSLVFASGVVEDCDTYRDVLGYLAAALCCVALIDRSGALVLKSFEASPELTFPASRRYSSQLSDFRSYYTGVYATYKEGGLSEYYRVPASRPDDGLVYNLGVNPFLQVSKDSVRKQMVQAIINKFSSFRYAPFSVNLPSYLILDPMDVVEFEGNQATAFDYGAITEAIYRINDKMDIACAGDNPRLNQAKSRYTKNIEGLLSGNVYSGGSSGSTDFWMIYDDNSDADQEIGSTATVVCALEVDVNTDHTRSQINFTVTYTLDEAAVVTIDVQADESSIYCVKDLQAAGPHTMTVTTGKAWEGRGKHEITIWLKEEAVT